MNKVIRIYNALIETTAPKRDMDTIDCDITIPLDFDLDKLTTQEVEVYIKNTFKEQNTNQDCLYWECYEVLENPIKLDKFKEGTILVSKSGVEAIIHTTKRVIGESSIYYRLKYLNGLNINKLCWHDKRDIDRIYKLKN